MIHGIWVEIKSREDLPDRTDEYIWQDQQGYYQTIWYSPDRNMQQFDFTKFVAWVYLEPFKKEGLKIF